MKRRYFLASALAAAVASPFLVSLASGAGVIVGFLALVIGMIVLPVLINLYSALAVPVTVLEGRDPLESLKRSFNLVKDDLGRVFLIWWVLFFALQLAAFCLVSLPTLMISTTLAEHGPVPLWFSALSDVVDFAVQCVVRPLVTIGFSIAYYDERVRKEALDMQFMMAAIDRKVASAGAAAAGVASA